MDFAEGLADHFHNEKVPMAANITSTENVEEVPGWDPPPPSQTWEETTNIDKKDDKLSLLKRWLDVTCPEWLNNLDVCAAIKEAETTRSRWVDGIVSSKIE